MTLSPMLSRGATPNSTLVGMKVEYQSSGRTCRSCEFLGALIHLSDLKGDETHLLVILSVERVHVRRNNSASFVVAVTPLERDCEARKMMQVRTEREHF